jgi:arsenite oxidase large subunit
MDPPDEAKPDWRIIADVAKKMGFEGFEWEDSTDVFEEFIPRSGGRKDFKVLAEYAQAQGKKPHEVLREAGTTGLQTPLSLKDGELVQTDRLHTDMKFKASNGKSNFVVVDLDAVVERNALLGPNSDEFWVLSGRVNHLWQSLYDDKRKPHLIQRFPVSFVELNPEDADRMGVVSVDMLAIESDRVRTAEGKIDSGGITAAAYVTDEVPPGVIFTMFHYPGSPANAVVTADATTSPINPRQPFKFGRAKVTRIGSTDLAEVMPFTPRNLV